MSVKILILHSLDVLMAAMLPAIALVTVLTVNLMEPSFERSKFSLNLLKIGRKLKKSENVFFSLTVVTIQTEAALTIDAVSVITKALSKMVEEEPNILRGTFRSLLLPFF